MARIFVTSTDRTVTIELAQVDPDDHLEQPWVGRCDRCPWTLTPADRASHNTADAIAAAEVHVDYQH